MKIDRATLLVGLVLTALAASAASAQTTVNVHFNPQSSTISAGSSFTVQLLADLPTPVVGWGLDLAYDTSLLSLQSVEMGPQWFAATAADGDGLAGLAFPAPVSGQSTILPILHFRANGTACTGTSSLVASFTPSDLREGFPLPLGDFADASFMNGMVTVTDSLAPAVSAALTAVAPVPSYRVSFNATDNCSVSALSGIMNVASFSGFRVDFALGAGKTSSIEIDPKKQRVSLKGASETEMRSRLAQIAAAGGVSVANGQVLALTQATDPVVKLTFQNGQLTAMQASQLGLTVKASDSSGNVAVATSSL